jgi:uncharacterized protein (DUF736 family)
MKTKFSEIEVKLVPTTFEHGVNAKKRITHVVVLIQAAWKHLNEAREALACSNFLLPPSRMTSFLCHPQ